MADKKSPVNLSIHLIKRNRDDIESFVAARSALDEHQIRFTEGAGRLFVKRPRTRAPRWTKFFSKQVPPDAFGKIASASAVLVLQVEERWFAITFGSGGRFLIDSEAVEERFGLLVVLNSIPEDGVRSLDKTTFDALATNSKHQPSREASPREFGLDVERDLIKAVTGTPADVNLGRRLHGMDALLATAIVELENLPHLLSQYLTRSRAKTYTKTFPWVDHIAKVKDAAIRERLDRTVVQRIRLEEFDACWLAVPEIVDWDRVDGFRYGGRPRNAIHHDIALPRWLAELDENTRGGFSPADVEVELLTVRRVKCLDADGSEIGEWPIYKCLNAELDLDGNSYLLSAGEWYKVERNFVRGVDEYFADLPRYTTALPEYDDETEGHYNARVATADPATFALMDKRNIPFGPNPVEFCDLYAANGDMIHVKRYGGSSVLSHLFAQGMVSGELFRMQADFRGLVNDRLPASHRIRDHMLTPEPEEYQVVFAIVSNQRDGELSIPFFSRLNLRSAARRLRAYGYRVAVAKVSVAERRALSKTYGIPRG